jgi:hypothetical protein
LIVLVDAVLEGVLPLHAANAQTYVCVHPSDGKLCCKARWLRIAHLLAQPVPCQDSCLQMLLPCQGLCQQTHVTLGTNCRGTHTIMGTVPNVSINGMGRCVY